MRRFFGGRSGKFKKNDLVKLNEDSPHPQLQTGAVGVVFEAHGGDHPAYEIEFIGPGGAILDRLVVKEAYLSAVDD